MTTQQSAPRQWVVQPGQPAPGLWWDRNSYRPINPSAPYPTSTKRSMRSVGTTIGLSLLILAVVALIVGMKFPPLLLLAAGLFCAGAVMFGLTTHVANKWVGKGEKDLHSTRDVLTEMYRTTPPAGWQQSSDRDAVYVQQDGLVVLGGAKNMASEQLRPIFPVWCNN